jgi:hypothetical protein
MIPETEKFPFVEATIILMLAIATVWFLSWCFY